MPRKVRNLIEELLRAGFMDRSGKGSHRNFRHVSGVHITLSGKPGDDAKPYQEKALALALKEIGK
ncbi:MAG: type II toxin-antitoxin system HicA family toxin [Kiritimatiellae bacterium]|nr:type II toxin-antitoxin system HicA family toxin [Kiritimatiellia bacterium]